MRHTYHNNGCFMLQHDVMTLSSVLVDISKLKKSGNSTTFFLGEAFDRNRHLWIQIVHPLTKAVLLRNAMSLMPMQVQRSLLPQHANDISESQNVMLLSKKMSH